MSFNSRLRSALRAVPKLLAGATTAPQPFGRIASKHRFVRAIKSLPLALRVGEAWREDPHEGMLHREYRSYRDYLRHQASKLPYVDLAEYDVKFRSVLGDRLRNLRDDWHGKRVLCLAARLGTEVKAFGDLGCFAIGIDINPGRQNRHVLWGDFHDLPFPARSVDVVFTNSLDHAFDFGRLLAEVTRVLAPHGELIVEVGRGKRDGKSPAFYESFWWPTIDDLVRESHRFTLADRRPFDYPWMGDQLRFGVAPCA